MESIWEEIYKKGELLKMEPHPEIEKIIRLLKKNNIKRVLDLGSGGGRHTVYLSRKGFEVYALDSSPTGLAFTMNEIHKKELSAHFTLHDMSKLPYDDFYFGAVISVQVIHHNQIEGIKRTAGEICRVLKDGGIIWITMPVSKNEPSTKQQEIEPGTFIPLNGWEKGLPHHYFKEHEIPLLFPDFDVIDLHVDPTNHFSFAARKKLKE